MAKHSKRSEPARRPVFVIGVIVCVVIVVVALGIGGLSALSLRAHKQPSEARTTAVGTNTLTKMAPPSTDPTQTARQARQQRLDTLKTSLNEQIAGYSGTWSVYVEDLGTGAAISVNDHRQPSASVIKLYVMLAVFEQIQQGHLQGTSAVDNLITQMITVSSNQAANTLVTMLGDGKPESGMQIVSNTAAANGFGETSMRDRFYDSGSSDPQLKQTSVNDVGAFLSKAYRGQLISPDISARMLNLMSGQQRRTKIPAGVPAGTKVANKTGEVPGVENDAAIVYAPGGDYALVVMSENVENTAAQTQVRAISATVWKTMGQ